MPLNPHLVEFSRNLVAPPGRHKNWDALLFGLFKSVGVGLTASHDDDPREIIQKGHRHDILV